jgi:hypothetical protein
MLTDDQLAQRIGPRLRAELADLPVHDLLPGLHARRARRTRRMRAAIVPAAAGALAVSLVFATGGTDAPAAHTTTAAPNGTALPGQPGHSGTVSGGTTITLAGYTLRLPPGYRVSKLGAGYQVTGPGVNGWVLFLVSGRKPPRPASATPVKVSSLNGWWVSMGAGRGGGELIVVVPASKGTRYLVTKADGPSVTEKMMISFMSQIDIGRMKPVNVACTSNCG